MIYVPLVFLIITTAALWQSSAVIANVCAKRAAAASAVEARLWNIAPRTFEIAAAAAGIASGWGLIHYFFVGSEPLARSPYVPTITLALFFVWAFYVVVGYVIVPLVFFISALASDERLAVQEPQSPGGVPQP